MADYDELYDFGANGEFIYSINEIPKGSSLKIEYDREKKVFVLDRVEPGIFAKPCNYGFIPRSLDEDGDALDTLLITDEAIPTGIVIKAKVIGVLDFEDGGENDHKIVCVPEDDRHSGSISSLEDIPQALRNQIEHHFNHYKDLKKPGTTTVRGWGDEAEAWKIIEACVSSFKG